LGNVLVLWSVRLVASWETQMAKTMLVQSMARSETRTVTWWEQLVNVMAEPTVWMTMALGWGLLVRTLGRWRVRMERMKDYWMARLMWVRL
jgi:hypothetical protein